MSRIVVIVGASGVGKTTLIKHVLDNNENKIFRLLPVTDREPRDQEINHIDKHFVDKMTFSSLVGKGKIKKYKELYGNRYGYFDEDLNKNQNSICEVYHKSYLKFKNQYKNVFGIYVRPISMEKIISGINSRGASIEECVIREKKLISELAEMELMVNQGIFDEIFINSYTDESKKDFANLICKLLG